MKNGFKRVSRRVLSTLLCLLILLSTMSVGFVFTADAETIYSGVHLFLKPNSNWTQENARFAAYFFNSSGNAWVSMEKAAFDNSIYAVKSPGDYANVVFCRMNPSTSANNWDNVWNQTSDLSYNGSQQLYTVASGTWSKGGGTWTDEDYTVSIPGTFNDWFGNDFVLTNTSGNIYEGTITLSAGTHNFKVLKGFHDWYGSTGTINNYTKSWNVYDWQDSKCTLTVDHDGEYKFIVDNYSNTLQILELTPPNITSFTYNASTRKFSASAEDKVELASYTLKRGSETKSSADISGVSWNGEIGPYGTGAEYVFTVKDACDNEASQSIKLYRTTFNYNNGEPEGFELTEDGAEFTLPVHKTDFTHPDGNEFLGWAISPTSTDYLSSSYKVNSADYSSYQRTLYAIWKSEYFLVSETNGKTVTTSTNKFVNGELTLDLESSSQVYVKNNVGDVLYKFNGACEETSGVLSTSGTGKMFVPAGNIKFKLIKNDDGTFVLSYEVLSLSDNDLSSNYRLKGSFDPLENDEWGDGSKFNYISSDTLSTTLYLPEDLYEFKVNDTDSDPGDSNKTGYWFIFNDGAQVENQTTAKATVHNATYGTGSKLNASGGIYTFIYDRNVYSNTSDDTLAIEYSPDFKFYYAVPESVVDGASVVSQIKFTGYEEKSVIMTKTNKTYQDMPIYEITFEKGSYNESVDLLNFNIINYNNGEVWHSQDEVISTATYVADINGRMFVYGADNTTEVKDFETDKVLSVPVFTINGGVTSVTSREKVTVNFGDYFTTSDNPDGTTVTLTVTKDEEAYGETKTVDANTTVFDFCKLPEGTYKFTATASTGTENDGYEDKPYTVTLTVSDTGLAPYYLVGNKIGDTLDSRDYPFEVSDIDPKVYQILSVPYSAVGGKGVKFRLSDGFNFYGPASDSVISEASDLFNGDVAFTSENAVTGTAYYTNSSVDNMQLTSTWDYVNVYYDTRDNVNKIYVTQVDQYYTTTEGTTVTLEADDPTVVYNTSTELTASFTGAFINTTDDSGYTGSLVFQFYKMNGTTIDPDEDTHLGNVRAKANKSVDTTATITVDNITEYSKFYVLVSPATNTTVRVPSPIEVVSIANEYKPADVKVYIDFEGLTPTNVTLHTVDIDATEVEATTMTKANTTIFTADLDLAYTVDRNGEITSNFTFNKVNIDGTDVYFTKDEQPDMDKILASGEIWYHLTSTDLTQTTTADTTKKYEIKPGYTTEADVPSISISNVDYETIRIYCTDSLKWGSVYVNYGSTDTIDDKWNGWVKMNPSGTNGYGETILSKDISATAKYVSFAELKDGNYNSVNPIKIAGDFDYNTNNAYYILTGGSEAAFWTTEHNPVSPIIMTYTETVNLSIVNGKPVSYDVTPIDYYDTVTYTLDEEKSSEGITLDKETGVVTAENAGTAYVTITPYGIIEGGKSDSYEGTPKTVTINVVDKTELSNLIYNAELIINANTVPYQYESSSFNAVLLAYNDALDAYRNSFDDSENGVLAAETKNLSDAIDNIEYLVYGTEENALLDLISYKSATATLTASNATASEVIKKITSNGIVDNETMTVTYAANDGTSSKINFTLTASALAQSTNATPTSFIEWTQDNTSLGDKLNVTNALYGDTTYVAEYTPAEPKNVVINYKYDVYDVDKSNNYEYLEGDQYLTEKVYETEVISMDASWFEDSSLNDSALKIIDKYTPAITNSYFNYKLSARPATYTVEADGSYIITAYLDRTVQMYTVMVNGKPYEGEYHFQEIITIDASDYVSDSEVYWYNKDDTKKTPISNSTKYQLRVTENMNLGVEAQDGKTVENSVVVTHAFSELDGSNNFHQNFFIQNFFDKDADANEDGVADNEFIGAGVFYYTFNENTGKPSNSKVYNYLENLDDFAIELATTAATDGKAATLSGSSYNNTGWVYSYSAVDDVNFVDGVDGVEKNNNDPTKLFRYSTSNGAYNYFYDKALKHSSSYAKYSYHLYAYYVYKDANDKYQVVLSDNYASAACYLPTADIQPQ